MNSVKKVPALLFLGRFQFHLFVEGSTQVLKFPFVPAVVRDLDVVDPVTLLAQIKSFAAQYKLAPSSITILLAEDLFFSKIITVLDPKSREEEIQAFVDSVPFEEPGLIKLPYQANIAVSVANRAYYDAFVKGFSQIGFSVEYIIPAFLLKKEVDLSKSQDLSSLALALKRASAYRQYSLLLQSVHASPVNSSEVRKNALKINKRTLILFGVFGVLLIVLIIVYIMTSNSSSKSPTKVSDISAKTSSTQEPVVQVETEKLKTMHIFYPQGEEAQVGKIISAVKDLGVTAITSESAAVSSASASLSAISFSPSVSEEQRILITEKLRLLIADLEIEEGDDSTAAATLTLVR